MFPQVKAFVRILLKLYTAQAGSTMLVFSVIVFFNHFKVMHINSAGE